MQPVLADVPAFPFFAAGIGTLIAAVCLVLAIISGGLWLVGRSRGWSTDRYRFAFLLLMGVVLCFVAVALGALMLLDGSPLSAIGAILAILAGGGLIVWSFRRSHV